MSQQMRYNIEKLQWGDSKYIEYKLYALHGSKCFVYVDLFNLPQKTYVIDPSFTYMKTDREALNNSLSYTAINVRARTQLEGESGSQV